MSRKESHRDIWIPRHGRYLNLLFLGRLLPKKKRLLPTRYENPRFWAAMIMVYLTFLAIPVAMADSLLLSFVVLIGGPLPFISLACVSDQIYRSEFFVLRRNGFAFLHKRDNPRIFHLKDIQEVVFFEMNMESLYPKIMDNQKAFPSDTNPTYSIIVVRKGGDISRATRIHDMPRQYLTQIPGELKRYLERYRIPFNGKTPHYYLISAREQELKEHEIGEGEELFEGLLRENPGDTRLRQMARDWDWEIRKRLQARDTRGKGFP